MADSGYSRRGFIQICGAAASAFAASNGQAGTRPEAVDFARVRLVDERDQALKLEALEPEREYVFFYPYVCTPCFLLRLQKNTTPVDLQTENGDSYRWPGGVGPDENIVAFAAICAHKLTHPSEPVSFIGYRQQPVGYYNKRKSRLERRSAVIQCCSEHSIYDPAAGAKVLSGPAPQPLASIALQDKDGELFATGVYGGLLYERFFRRFEFRLQLEFGDRALDQVSGVAQVMPMEHYTRHRIQC